MADVVVSIGAINFDKLDADIRAAVTTFSGMSRGKDRSKLTLHFEERASEEDMATAQGLVLSHDPTSKTPAQQTLEAIRSTAQGAAGKSLTELTAAEVRSLLAALLYKAGGVNADGTVRPLAEWLR